MENKHYVHNLIILDESGSMSSIEEIIMKGFNELVQTIQGVQKEFPEQEHTVSFVSFNAIKQKLLHFVDPVSKLNKIDANSYQPDGGTPLYDAMGFSINKLKQFLIGKTNYNVLVTILTDGEENASREFSQKDIKKIIEELKDQSWTFTYIGTDHDVTKVSNDLGIVNSMSFFKDEEGIKEMFMIDQSARYMYSKKIRFNEETTSNYFDDIDKDDNI